MPRRRHRKKKHGFFESIGRAARRFKRRAKRAVKKAMPAVQTAIDVGQMFAPAGLTKAIDMGQAAAGMATGTTRPQDLAALRGLAGAAMGPTMQRGGSQLAATGQGMIGRGQGMMRDRMGGAMERYGRFAASPLSGALSQTAAAMAPRRTRQISTAATTARQMANLGSGTLARRLGRV